MKGPAALFSGTPRSRDPALIRSSSEDRAMKPGIQLVLAAMLAVAAFAAGYLFHEQILSAVDFETDEYSAWIEEM